MPSVETRDLVVAAKILLLFKMREPASSRSALTPVSANVLLSGAYGKTARASTCASDVSTITEEDVNVPLGFVREEEGAAGSASPVPCTLPVMADV